MFNHLVVPLDGSESAARALPVAVDLAARAEASVDVLGVARTDAELAWTFHHVVVDAARAGIDDAHTQVVVDPEPEAVIARASEDEHSVLCLASRMRKEPAAHLTRSVGSLVIERARHPVVVVGRNASAASGSSDVVVALAGFEDEKRLLDIGAEWARQLRATLRLVTVYEPVLPEPTDPEVIIRRWGPPSDPHAYLSSMRAHVDDAGPAGVETVAIRDMNGPAAGIRAHLDRAPARLVVLGRGTVAHDLLDKITVPLLLANP